MTLKHWQRAEQRARIGIYYGDACVLARRHRLLRSMPSKFPVSDREPGDHMWPGREMITNGSGHLKGKCHDWTKNDDGIGNRLAGRVTACDGCAGSRWRRRRWRWWRWWRRRRTRGRWRL